MVLQPGKNTHPSPAPPSTGLPKMSLFFPLSRHNFHSFFPLLWVFSRNFGVFEAPDLTCARSGGGGSGGRMFRWSWQLPRLALPSSCAQYVEFVAHKEVQKQDDRWNIGHFLQSVGLEVCKTPWSAISSRLCSSSSVRLAPSPCMYEWLPCNSSPECVGV